MIVEWWQLIIIVLYSGYQILDELHVYSALSSPVFAGLLVGVLMGDITTGLFIGGSMQLTILGVGTFGGASRIDANSGTIIAAVFAIALDMDPEQAIAALAVPVASLLVQMDVLGRFANTYFAKRIDTKIEEMDYSGIERNYLYGILPWSLSRMLPVGLALAFGGGVIQNVVSVLNNELLWLGDGLSVAGAVLPAVGFAILLKNLPAKKHIAYLILGFTITALLSTVFNNIQILGQGVSGVVENFGANFNSLPMLAVSFIGLGLAILSYKNSSNPSVEMNTNQIEVNTEAKDQGEILDDEL